METSSSLLLFVLSSGCSGLIVFEDTFWLSPRMFRATDIVTLVPDCLSYSDLVLLATSRAPFTGKYTLPFMSTATPVLSSYEYILKMDFAVPVCHVIY